MAKFFKRHFWLVVIIFLVILFPQSLSDQTKLNMRVIITGVGIDFIDNKYQVTSQIITPSSTAQSGSINAEVSYITATGDSISDCVQTTSYKLGKITELSHMEFILVGESMKNHNLTSSLDYFFRNFKLKKSLMLIACFGQAKEAIHKTSELELDVSLSLQKIYLSHENSLSALATSYIDFISDSYSISGTSVLDTLEITSAQKQQSSNEDSSTNTQSSQSNNTSSSSTAVENAEIEIYSPLILFKNGLFYGSLQDKNEVLGYFFADKKANMGNVIVTNFSYGEALNSNINIRIDRMYKKHRIEFSNGKPVHIIDINIQEAKIDEIAPSTNANTHLYSPLSIDLQQSILNSAKQQIQQLVHTTYKKCVEQNFDIFKTANLCNKFHYNKWQSFINNIDNPSQYMQHINLVVNVKFSQIT